MEGCKHSVPGTALQVYTSLNEMNTTRILACAVFLSWRKGNYVRTIISSLFLPAEKLKFIIVCLIQYFMFTIAAHASER